MRHFQASSRGRPDRRSALQQLVLCQVLTSPEARPRWSPRTAEQAARRKPGASASRSRDLGGGPVPVSSTDATRGPAAPYLVNVVGDTKTREVVRILGAAEKLFGFFANENYSDL